MDIAGPDRVCALRRRRWLMATSVRIAIGALPMQIRNQFLSIGARLLVSSAVIGMGGAWLAGRAMQSVLFNVPPLHPPNPDRGNCGDGNHRHNRLHCAVASRRSSESSDRFEK